MDDLPPLYPCCPAGTVRTERLSRRTRHLSGTGDCSSLAQDFFGDLLTEGAVAFPLHVVEDLIGGRILRKSGVHLAVVDDVLGQSVAEAGFEEENPRNIRAQIISPSR